MIKEIIKWIIKRIIQNIVQNRSVLSSNVSIGNTTPFTNFAGITTDRGEALIESEVIEADVVESENS